MMSTVKFSCCFASLLCFCSKLLRKEDFLFLFFSYVKIFMVQSLEQITPVFMFVLTDDARYFSTSFTVC